jgi:ATP-dependent helicase/nuclease subunit A
VRHGRKGNPARWLTEAVLSRPQVKPGHIALLFRKLTQADTYVDALRRYGLPYVIEGEKHFYRRQEVIDLMNVLRVLTIHTILWRWPVAAQL